MLYLNLLYEVTLVTVVEGDPKDSFSIGTTSSYRGRFFDFTPNIYVIMLSV